MTGLRKALAWLAAVLVASSLAACSLDSAKASFADAGKRSSASSEQVSQSAASSEAASASASAASSASGSSAATAVGFELADVPEYAGTPSVEVNGGEPFFSEADFERGAGGAFEEYSPLDSLGRCGVAFALVGPETMPDEPRGSIGMVKPSGWHTVRYDGLVDGNYLYNRCHLIGYQLTGENANERNLITGTRAMNVEGMLPFEDRVASYVERTGNHVLYRSMPVFEGDDLVARGVLLEAESVEDAGAALRFCAWCYNVEPGVEIDYATGESALAEGAVVEAATAEAAEPVAASPEPAAEPAAEDSEPAAAAEAGDVRTYVLNTNTHKFHYPDCSSVRDMAEHNKRVVESTHDEIVAEGYDPCKRCNP